MPRRQAFALFLLLCATGATAQQPQVSFTGETMRLRSASVTASGPAWNVGLVMEDDNADPGLPTSYRRWWHCQVGNLQPGTTLNFTVSNAGYSDVILPVWAHSSDGGTTFGAYQRCPTSAVPTVTGSSTHRFSLVVPPGVNALRLAKYFPYSVARKDAWLASLAGHPRLRSSSVLGQSHQGRPIHLLEFTNAAVPDAGKQRIWIHAGAHPAETTSYFAVEGLVQWLGSGQAEPELLLRHAIVDVVPMMNPDGVFLGNYRTNWNSQNLEDLWGSPYTNGEPEITALRTRIEQFMGTPQHPGSNPIRVLLNLHSSHNVAFPFHFEHTANPNWHPVSSNAGVIPAVNALERQWIAAFRASDPFTNLGTTQSSSAGAPSRPFVESMMHDRWSAVAAWTTAGQQPVMAITWEGTYRMGPAGAWNTEADYRTSGENLGRALVTHLGLQFTSGIATYGTACTALGLSGTIRTTGQNRFADLFASGAPAHGPAWLVLGFARQQTPLPAPFGPCPLLTDVVVSTGMPIGPFGFGSLSVPIPPIPGLVANLQCLALDLQAASPAVDTSNGLEVRNHF